VRRAREWQFLRACEPVLDTPPIAARDDGLVIFSMIGTRVVLPYLVAIKSLHHHLPRGRAVILDDGTLSADDKAVLAAHLDGPEILHGPSVDTQGCPTYSSWRRLFALLPVRRDNFVIQLDSDIVVTGPVDQVGRSIDANENFILMGEPGVEFRDPAAIAAHARPIAAEHGADTHVQIAIEAKMDKVALPGIADPRYARGCAGFAGFARGDDGIDLARAFSAEADRLIGRDKWREWGSEQVTSNVLIANQGQANLLDYDSYCNFWDQPVPADMSLVHFIGTYRYHRGVYGRLAREAIARLHAGEARRAA
jgi:hypothetical protein